MAGDYTFAATAVLGATVTSLALLAMRREIFHGLDLMDEWRGSLRQGRILHPENVHRAFSRRHHGVPTLLAFVSAGCEYCDEGLLALCDAIPREKASYCVAYEEKVGLPDLLAGPLRSRILAAPVSFDHLDWLRLKGVPRWIWLSAGDKVVSDLSGFAGDISLKLLMNGLSSALHQR